MSDKRRANGEGTFIDLGNGKLLLKKQIGYKSNGKPYTVSATGNSKTECLRKMKAKEKGIAAIRHREETLLKSTVADLCYAHFNYHLSQKDRLKPKSADRRETTIKNQIEGYEIGITQCAAVKPKDIVNHIEQLISEDKLSVSSISKALNVLNAAYKWGISQGFLAYNPCESVMEELRCRLNKLEAKESCETDVVIMSEEEEELFLKEADRLYMNGKPKYKISPYAKLLLYTGMRCGELCALKWISYDREMKTLDISRTRYEAKNRDKNSTRKTKAGEGTSKNVKARVIVLTDEAAEVIEYIYSYSKMTSPDDYIMINGKNKPMTPDKFGQRVNTIYKNAGLDHMSGLHILRRTFATKMYDDGATIKAIAGYIGDLESTVSKHYIAIRKRVKQGGKVKNVVPVPVKKKEE